jgi:hypothetical protein
MLYYLVLGWILMALIVVWATMHAPLIEDEDWS